MEIRALGWLGTRTERPAELADFYEHVLQLPLVHREDDFFVFQLPDGSNVEVFGPGAAGKEHFETGPVAGFRVDDLAAATATLAAHGIELLGEPGPTWQHFRAPDGNVYELVVDSP